MLPSRLLIGLLVFAALTVSAEESTVADSIPQAWVYDAAQFQSSPAVDGWWSEFADPVLNHLISVGVDRNYDVATALRRIEMARQSIRQARSGYYPSFGAYAGWTKEQSSGNMTKYSTPAEKMDYLSLGIDMAWEIDVFGRVTSGVKESKAQFRATQAEYLATINSICAEIASSYIELRTLQATLTTARSHLEEQGKALKIAEARHEAGLNSKLDVAQASTIYYSTAATIPSLESQIDAELAAIAVLLGDYPQSLEPLRREAPIPDYSRIVAVGVPMDLLRRRPDIQAAEAQMAAAAAAVGVSKKDFLPTLSINGSFGVASHKPGDLFKGRSMEYSIAPKLSWTIFDGFARSAAVASARENLHIAVNSYNQQVLTAVQEVQSAIAAYHGAMATINALQKVVEAAHEEATLSLDLYKQGLQDFLAVANAQIAYLQYSEQLARARGTAAGALVTLYKALGGGWSSSQKN